MVPLITPRLRQARQSDYARQGKARCSATLLRKARPGNPRPMMPLITPPLRQATPGKPRCSATLLRKPPLRQATLTQAKVIPLFIPNYATTGTSTTGQAPSLYAYGTNHALKKLLILRVFLRSPPLFLRVFLFFFVLPP